VNDKLSGRGIIGLFGNSLGSGVQKEKGGMGKDLGGAFYRAWCLGLVIRCLYYML